MQSDLTKKTIKGFYWLLLTKILRSGFQLIILGILSRLLNPEDFGLMSLVLIVVNLADIFSDIGLGPAITQKKELTQKDISTSFTSSIFLGIFLMLAFQISAPLIGQFYKNTDLVPLIKFISITFFLISISTTANGLMYRDLKYKNLTIMSLVSYILGYGLVSTILAYKGYGVYSLIIGLLIQNILTTSMTLYFERKSIKLGWNKDSFKQLFNYGSGFTLGRIFTFIANQGDKIIIGKFMDVATLGLYERSYQIVRYAAGIIGELIDKTLFSPISKMQDNRGAISKVFLEITYILSVLIFPLSAYIIQNSKYIVLLLLGEKFVIATPIVTSMAITLFFWIATKLSNTIAKSVGEVYNRALRNFIYAVLIIIGTYVGVQYGILMVSYIVTFIIFINYILSYLQVRNFTNLNDIEFIKNHIFGCFIAILSFLSSFWIKNLSDNIFINLISTGIIYAAIIFISLMYFDKKNIIKKYKQKIIKK